MNLKRPHYFFLAAEPSADTLGAQLIDALKEKESGPAIYEGIGGPQMEQRGLSSLLPFKQFQIMGFSEILKSLPRLWQQMRTLTRHILHHSPDAVILIDYPGFNLRLAHRLKKQGFKGKIIFYVCPTIWAWGSGRKQKLVEDVDYLMTIFPFEPALFKDTTLQVEYVGHPLIQKIKNHVYDSDWAHSCGINLMQPLIALFPGSRPSEIQRNLPRQLEAARLIKQIDPSITIAISAADSVQLPPHPYIVVPQKYTYELMRAARSAIATSGTVTLELALHETPTLVTYELSRFNHFIANHILRLNLPAYCIVNILCNCIVFPEFITFKYTSVELLEWLLLLHKEGSEREVCLNACRKLKQILGMSQANERAAEIIRNAIDAG